MEKHLCPLCQKYYFEKKDDYCYCNVCNWCNEAMQEDEPDLIGINNISLNIAREKYKKGLSLDEAKREFIREYCEKVPEEERLKPFDWEAFDKQVQEDILREEQERKLNSSK